MKDVKLFFATGLGITIGIIITFIVTWNQWQQINKYKHCKKTLAEAVKKIDKIPYHEVLVPTHSKFDHDLAVHGRFLNMVWEGGKQRHEILHEDKVFNCWR